MCPCFGVYMFWSVHVYMFWSDSLPFSEQEGRKIYYFFATEASCPNTNIFTEKWSSLDFHLCVWYNVFTEGKNKAIRQKNISLRRRCIRAFSVRLLHYSQKAVLTARAGQVARAMGNEARTNVSFSNANKGKKL